MNLYFIENYKSNTNGLSGSELTDYLITRCVWESTGKKAQVKRLESGKPVVLSYDKNTEDIFVSVSHSNNLFACIVSECNIGLDIQYRRNVKVENIAGRFFSEKESDIVLDNPDEFFRLWARKEAFSKYTGDGLKLVMRKTDVIERDDVTFRDIVLHDISSEPCYVAICAKKGTDLYGIQIFSRKQD